MVSNAHVLVYCVPYPLQGGQILRNAAALSCLLKIPVTVNNIRAGRNNPGLRYIRLPGREVTVPLIWFYSYFLMCIDHQISIRCSIKFTVNLKALLE